MGKSEGGIQMTEGRGQMTEDRRQMTEDRMQRAENRRPRWNPDKAGLVRRIQRGRQRIELKPQSRPTNTQYLIPNT